MEIDIEFQKKEFLSIWFYILIFSKNLSVTLTGLARWVGCYPADKRMPVQFLVGAHAWVVGQVPGWGHVNGSQSMFLSHIGVSLPFFLLSLPSL